MEYCYEVLLCIKPSFFWKCLASPWIMAPPVPIKISDNPIHSLAIITPKSPHTSYCWAQLQQGATHSWRQACIHVRNSTSSTTKKNTKNNNNKNNSKREKKEKSNTFGKRHHIKQKGICEIEKKGFVQVAG